ncbi:hypothetical protein M8J76_015578 [Diaphorina citri]|nr:hypothetical protein M8J76_015578 [Diaphorina citri]
MAEFRYVLSSMIAATAAFLFLTQGCVGLRNVTLVISPQAVNRGQDVTLYCNYDLEKQPLYSVKWYRGKLEFYRFSPGESPATKIFYYPGINVDLSRSNASQVVLQNVDFNMSGNLSCEVTTDFPSFSTKLSIRRMMVVGWFQQYVLALALEEGDEIVVTYQSLDILPEASSPYNLSNSTPPLSEEKIEGTKEKCIKRRSRRKRRRKKETWRRMWENRRRRKREEDVEEKEKKEEEEKGEEEGEEEELEEEEEVEEGGGGRE